jgi:hypothetical protein
MPNRIKNQIEKIISKVKALREETINRNNLDIDSEIQYIQSFGSDSGYFQNYSDIRIRLENIKLNEFLVILRVHFVGLSVSSILILSKPNFVYAKSLIQSEKNSIYFSTQIEEQIPKKIIRVDLREPKEQKNINLDEEEIFQFHEQNVKQNLKIDLSKKHEGIFNPIKFVVLAKNSNINIFSKEEKTFFIKKFYFFISWIIKNKILIFSFAIGSLIVTLIIYYAIQKNSILNLRQIEPEITLPILSKPKKLSFDCMNRKINLNNQKKQLKKLVKLFNRKVEYFKQNGRRLYPDKIKYAEKRFLYTDKYERLANLKRVLEEQIILVDNICF